MKGKRGRNSVLEKTEELAKKKKNTSILRSQKNKECIIKDNLKIVEKF